MTYFRHAALAAALFAGLGRREDVLIPTRLTSRQSSGTRHRLCSLSLAMPAKRKIATVPPMTAEEAARLKQLALDAYDLDAFKPNLTQAEARRRIAMLSAKLQLLDSPPHTL